MLLRAYFVLINSPGWFRLLSIMVAKNNLFRAQPYPVEQALRRLGKDLRTARLRRRLTIEKVCAKIGTGPRAVRDAEKGKASTGIAIYLTLLWTYDLLAQLDEVANPLKDKQGMTLAAAEEKKRARQRHGLDNDF